VLLARQKKNLALGLTVTEFDRWISSKLICSFLSFGFIGAPPLESEQIRWAKKQHKEEHILGI
jgi:hypothetical protein